MRTLGSTLSQLSRFRRHWSTLLHSTPAMRPSDAPPSSHLTELTNFGSNPGALGMFTYVPKNLAPSPALVVVLHGCMQSAASYDLGAGWSTLADRYGFVLLLPEQSAANNPKTCFTWFLNADTTRDRGEVLSIRQMIEKTIGAHGIDRDRVFITGLSAGGAMANAMLASYPEVFAAGAIIAGLPYGTARNVQEAFDSMFQGRTRSAKSWGDLVRRASHYEGPWPRISIWHGDADQTVQPVNADSLVQQWTNVHGIDAPPTEDMVLGYPRKVWRRHGVDMIESLTITGMAHGTPLASADREQGCGTSGPFLLEAGISSSFHIATFFGLIGAPRAGVRQAGERHGEPAHASLIPDEVEVIPDERVEVLDSDAYAESEAEASTTFKSRHAASRPIDVMAVITKALESAGLMKPPK